jgi:thiamine kinase-like enzyme
MNSQFQTPSPAQAVEASMITKYELLLHHQSAMMSAQRMAHRYEAEQKKEWSKFFKSKAKLEALTKELNIQLPAVENEVQRTLSFNH